MTMEERIELLENSKSFGDFLVVSDAIKAFREIIADRDTEIADLKAAIRRMAEYINGMSVDEAIAHFSEEPAPQGGCDEII